MTQFGDPPTGEPGTQSGRSPMTEDEIEALNEQSISAASKRSLEAGGQWVTCHIVRFDGSEDYINVRSKGPNSLEVR